MLVIESLLFGLAIIFTLSFLVKSHAEIIWKKNVKGSETSSYLALIAWVFWYYIRSSN